MTELDHFILKVNDLETSLAFYTDVMGFEQRGTEGPFTVLRVSKAFQIQLAPWGTQGGEHYAFAVSKTKFDRIYKSIREKNIDHGPSFHDVGANTGPGVESGAKGEAPTLYFNDPNKHLLEIRTYAEDI